MQVSEDGEIDFSLQAGRRADCDAGTLALDAKVSFLQVQDLMVLVVLRDGAKAFLPWFPLQKRSQNIDYSLTLTVLNKTNEYGNKNAFCLIFVIFFPKTTVTADSVIV